MRNVGSEFLKIRLGSRCVAIIDGRKRSFSKAIDGLIKPAEMQKLAITLLEAYGFSMPDPDSDDEDSGDEEEENPNQETGL